MSFLADPILTQSAFITLFLVQCCKFEPISLWTRLKVVLLDGRRGASLPNSHHHHLHHHPEYNLTILKIRPSSHHHRLFPIQQTLQHHSRSTNIAKEQECCYTVISVTRYLFNFLFFIMSFLHHNLLVVFTSTSSRSFLICP